ncbi:phosphatidate cytidylyltransferase [Vibrio sp. SM6]|uniref:Phosphatidate cytidylyltransferase n=1 Tax=Vibrio agarilyticus TaxID=2726741 RepID=A0A7X8TQU4_9VIBR|nr:phosphatidate cytidylyltransferase [Vibrio agarilyticus]NLS13158.1 phosphatidate cytidylyltransferase [Vibrio agarilyticus]
MKQRIITALLLAPLVVWGIFQLPFFFFLAAVTGVTLLGFWEWTKFTGGNSRLLALIPSLFLVGLSFAFMPVLPQTLSEAQGPVQWMLLVGVVWWVVASLMAITYPHSSQFWSERPLFSYLFGALTLIPFLWSVALLRSIHLDVDPYYGAKLVLFVSCLVWAADSGAYFAGKSLGKHKMAPQVSPNKTIEGLVGGVIAALVVGWWLSGLFNIEFNGTVHMLVVSFFTVVISVLGDLVESMFKRVACVKDSGRIIPGHGGVLDRIDSLTAAFPVFAFLYLVF